MTNDIYRGSATDIARLALGNALWHFDINHRVYKPAPDGQSRYTGGPIYREHYTPRIIVGETKRSWLVEGGGRSTAKVSKVDLTSAREHAASGFFTTEAMEADIWLHEHKHEILRQLQMSRDAFLFKQIAGLIGYVDNPAA